MGRPFGGYVAFSVEDAVLLVLLVGYASWWAHDLRRGTAVHRVSLAMHILVYAVLSFYVLLMGAYALGLSHADLAASGFYEILLLPVVFILATGSGYRFARRKLTVMHAPDGRWLYRGATVVPVIWLLLWGIRLAIEDGLLNGYSVFLPFLGDAPAKAHTVAPTTFDLGVGTIVILYFVSFGVMTGLSIAAWAVFRRARREGNRGSLSPGTVLPTPTQGGRTQLGGNLR